MSAGTATRETSSTSYQGEVTRVGQRIRVEILHNLKKELSNVQGVVVVRVEKVSTADLNRLRQTLISSQASFSVVKNSLCCRAFRELGWESLEKALEVGTCAVSSIRGDISAACKVLGTFSKDREGFLLQGGVVAGHVVSGKEIVEIGKLPSREVLLSQLAGMAQSPIRRFAFVIQAPIRSLALILNVVKQKKSATELGGSASSGESK